jgi:hypothetical protein
MGHSVVEGFRQSDTWGERRKAFEDISTRERKQVGEIEVGIEKIFFDWGAI